MAWLIGSDLFASALGTWWLNTQTAFDAHAFDAHATDAASHGGQVVSQVIETMHEITDSSRRIADIIGVIDGIAFQTNILALNTAVEAGSTLVNSAGDAMEGIVNKVTEVSHLIEQISQASKEQATGIDQVTSAVGHLDEVTQQNAALVHQSTQAAGSTGAECESLGRGDLGVQAQLISVRART
jgi:methyl-accepting chemotaxis protein